MKDIDSYISKNAKNNEEKVWDDELKQYYIEFGNNGAIYKIWIEDEKSIEEKLKLIKTYNLAGSAFWSKDRETEGVWKLLTKIE